MALAPQSEQRLKILLRPMSAQLPGGAESVKKDESRRSALMEPVLRLPEKRAARQVERILFRTGAEEWTNPTGEDSRPPSFVPKPGQSGEPRRRSSRKQRARRRIYWVAGVFSSLAFFWAGLMWNGRRANITETSLVNLEALAMSVRSMDKAVEAMHMGEFAEARLLAADARRAHPEIAGSYLIEGEAALAEEGYDPDSRHAFADRRAAALQLIDEAVKARHEERYDEAVALAKKAAEKNPQAASVDMLLAELAFHRGESQILRQATERAMSFPDYESGTKLLLALDHWRRLMREGKTDEASRRYSMDLLSEATSAQPSLDATWFFRGDLLRQTGQPAEAHQCLLGSMHRQYPWRSSTLLMERVSQLGGNSDIRIHRNTVDSREGGNRQSPGDETQKIHHLRTLAHWQWIITEKNGGGASSAGEVSVILKARSSSVPYAKILAPQNDSLRDAEGF